MGVEGVALAAESLDSGGVDDVSGRVADVELGSAVGAVDDRWPGLGPVSGGWLVGSVVGGGGVGGGEPPDFWGPPAAVVEEGPGSFGLDADDEGEPVGVGGERRRRWGRRRRSRVVPIQTLRVRR